MTTFRFLGKIFLLFVALSYLITVVFAHSGRTDSDGGHYDRDTGIYHYHHGKSAHDHYDINGDGIDDCPLTFWEENKPAKRKETSSESGIEFVDVVEAGFDTLLLATFSSFIAALIVAYVASLFVGKENEVKIFDYASVILFFCIWALLIYYRLS